MFIEHLVVPDVMLGFLIFIVLFDSQSHTESFQLYFPDEESLYMNAKYRILTLLNLLNPAPLTLPCHENLCLTFRPSCCWDFSQATDSNHLQKEKHLLYLLEPGS